MSAANHAPVIVGVYGIPGSGKTYLLRQLKQELGRENFDFFEGSKVIASHVTGGLEGFRQLSEQGKLSIRQCAINFIRSECLNSGKLGVVTGHYLFWTEGEEMGQPVCTPRDLETYTHILYLDIAPELIAQRRQSDSERNRPSASVDHLREWKNAEITQLRNLCQDHDILFHPVSVTGTLVEKVSTLLFDFKRHTEAYNLSCAERRLDEILGDHKTLETMLVLDADKTLTTEDTGELFQAASSKLEHKARPLSFKGLFGGSLGYSYTAFRQAALLYEEIAEKNDFDALCYAVASKLEVHPEMLSLLRLIAEQDHVGAVIMTCGLRHIWEKVLDKEGLSKVKVIGGGRIADGYVVTASVKESVVGRLRSVHRLYVVAFGDSPLDLPMLSAADQAIVVVGPEKTRSKSMDTALRRAIEHNGLQASQTLLPIDSPPRLDVAQLPVVHINTFNFIDPILRRCGGPSATSLRVLHATGRNSSRLLMTPTRDANINGPALREAHRRVGWFLATEMLTELIGLEEYPIPHVQGHQASGFRLRDEQCTSIIALMRGGEPMALGVSDALPGAMFVHTKYPDDVLEQHLDGQRTVILVDSVVNSGKTVVEFVQRIRVTHSTIRIAVIAGVVQTQCTIRGALADMLANDSSLHLIALRLSDNKFTGRGTTDTGNRLFNTTRLQQ